MNSVADLDSMCFQVGRVSFAATIQAASTLLRPAPGKSYNISL
jgi:hypothetical protein